MEIVRAADATDDWREVLKWQGRLEELMAFIPEPPSDVSEQVLALFLEAHRKGVASTGSTEHALPMVALQTRRVALLGKMERFRDQGEEMCSLADRLFTAGKRQESVWWLERARKVAEAHGFFSVECRACLGLGDESVEDGRHEQGVDLLRNALAAASLSEDEHIFAEACILPTLIEALFTTNNAPDELETLVPRFRAAAKAESRKKKRLGFAEMRSLYLSARLHEARGRPDEAVGEVRALLALIRENRATVQEMAVSFRAFMEQASVDLNVLDPETGDDELIDVWVDELTRLRGV
mmetsp:Transcript_56094/g.133904  ORF Transcript_56094/g.133904 Transcript_56094/m.133904 type:complete len:296 (-) Transcript_56094:42-929(-)